MRRNGKNYILEKGGHRFSSSGLRKEVREKENLNKNII